MSKIQIGDKVRFLNAVGGGKVTRIDAKNNLVYVEDEDGFDIPILANECVVIPDVNEKTNFPKKDFSSQASTHFVESAPMQKVKKEENLPFAQSVEIYETEEGDDLQAFLAFIPTDIKKLSESKFTCLLINDSNYFLFYNLIIGQDEARISHANGLIEPNMQEVLSEISTAQLNDWEHVQMQIIPFKQAKIYTPQAAIDKELHISALKFFKLHSFTANDYLDEQAMLFELSQADYTDLLDISTDAIKQAMQEKKQPVKQAVRKRIKPNSKQAIIEVDLHIHQLIDTTAGLSNADMLNLQLDKFHAILAENKQKKGQKIVFIHGKGEGVLRNEITKLLKTRYKNYYFQDASFREYGFGATMVTIK